MLRAELPRLLLGRHFQSSGEQGVDGRHGDVFHLRQVDVESGAVLAPVLPDDDFSPPLCQFLDSTQVFGGQFPCGHIASLQAFA